MIAALVQIRGGVLLDVLSTKPLRVIVVDCDNPSVEEHPSGIRSIEEIESITKEFREEFKRNDVEN